MMPYKDHDKNLAAAKIRCARRYSLKRDEILRDRKAKRDADPEPSRAYHRRYYHEKVKRKYKFGIDPEQFEKKLLAQGGFCAICGIAEPTGKTKSWTLDHCHRFSMRDPAGHREILCSRCNVMIGMSTEREATLLAAVKYLTRWNAVQAAISPQLERGEHNGSVTAAAGKTP